MWHDHPLSQGNMTTERTMGLGVGGDNKMEGGGVDKIWKRGEDWQYRGVFMTTERTMGLGVGGDRKRGVDKIWKRGEDWQYRGVFMK